MERLRSSDPARIADHRLLGRLGAGGMGVVYLARTPSGSLVALKVLAAEYAEDAGFRERFRREVDAARRIRSPWAVPVVAADADAEAPWLATAYVPGPSLAEAVASYGPLPEHGVRVLGGRLAQALAEVHRAGLVHRDLKPGNVLLAVDGPRLIDFGIARAPEDTALTATGFVIGTPGYLAPEQADGRGDRAIGAAVDVFSLGCVLAFAATGRPPFGTGALDALLYRAVHDPADLDGVPTPLSDLLARCLEKDPAHRPEVEELVRELLPGELAGGADGEGSSPRVAGEGSAAADTAGASAPTATAEASPSGAAPEGSATSDTGGPAAAAATAEASVSGAASKSSAAADTGVPAAPAEATRGAGPGESAEAAAPGGDAVAPDAGSGAAPAGTPADRLDAGDGGGAEAGAQAAAGAGAGVETEARFDDKAGAEAGAPAHSEADAAADEPVGGGGGSSASWLPEEVVRLIARRSTEALALPDIDRTEIAAGVTAGASPDATPADATPTDAVPGGGSPHGAVPQSSDTGSGADTASPAPGAGDTVSTAGAADAPARRRVLLAGAAGAVLVAGGGATWWALGRDSGSGGGKPAAASRRPAHIVALHGDLSGGQRDTGRAQERGLRLAVAEFNARRDAPFQVDVRAVDDAGDPAESARLAKRLADDPAVLAVIGPTTDATAQSALAEYDAAFVPVLGVSPGAIGLSVQGFRTFLNTRLPDSVISVYLDAVLRGAHPRRVGVVVDRAADNYGWEISSTLSKQLNTAGQPYIPRVVSTMRSGFEEVVDDLLAADTDSFAFAGLPDRAASFARTLRERGFSGARAGGPALLDPRFLTAAKEDADGWAIVAPIIDPTGVPAAKAFVAAYRKRWREAPPRYAVEAYDTASLVLTSLAGLPAKGRTREDLFAALLAAKYEGITRTYAFQEKTGLPAIDGTGGHLWRVEDGAFVYGGPAPLTA
ncbi:ABC transporter substrate-binding protein [Streptomyces scabiei]|nr:ABC transporter substrate-binding protein [Streptomyces griseiscabiei]